PAQAWRAQPCAGGRASAAAGAASAGRERGRADGDGRGRRPSRGGELGLRTRRRSRRRLGFGELFRRSVADLCVKLRRSRDEGIEIGREEDARFVREGLALEEWIGGPHVRISVRGGHPKLAREGAERAAPDR